MAASVRSFREMTIQYPAYSEAGELELAGLMTEFLGGVRRTYKELGTIYADCICAALQSIPDAAVTSMSPVASPPVSE